MELCCGHWQETEAIHVPQLGLARQGQSMRFMHKQTYPSAQRLHVLTREGDAPYTCIQRGDVTLRRVLIGQLDW